MDYQEWLESLKVGDTVTYFDRWRGDVLVKIINITPKRWIKTEGGHVFKNGKDRNDSWNSIEIGPVTMEIKLRIKRKNLLSKLKVFDFDKLTTEQLERIKQIVLE